MSFNNNDVIDDFKASHTQEQAAIDDNSAEQQVLSNMGQGVSEADQQYMGQAQADVGQVQQAEQDGFDAHYGHGNA